MTDKKTQKTKKGHEIPIPTKGEFLKNLKKVAKGKKAESSEKPDPTKLPKKDSPKK